MQSAHSSFILALNSGASNSSYRVEAMSGIRKAIFAFWLPPPPALEPELDDEEQAATAVITVRAAAVAASALRGTLFIKFSSALP